METCFLCRLLLALYYMEAKNAFRLLKLYQWRKSVATYIVLGYWKSQDKIYTYIRIKERGEKTHSVFTL